MLNLDAARFGPIHPKCASALREFASLLQNEGAIPQFSEFLLHGATVWPQRTREAYPQIATWPGLPEFKDAIAELVTCVGDFRVLLSGTSRELLRILCSVMASRCERVLCTDADWPEFRAVLEQESARTGLTLVEAPIRERHQQTHSFGLSRNLAQHYRDNHCDGAFLTPVTSDGIEINVLHFQHALGKIVPEFFIVDGAQQIGHVPVSLPGIFNGAYLAGAHKWLGSGMPLAFTCLQSANAVTLEADVRRAIRATQSDDAILLETADVGLAVPQQTVRIEPLILASIAVRHALSTDIKEQISARLRNAHRIKDALKDLGWNLSIQQSNGIVTVPLSAPVPTNLADDFRSEGVLCSLLPDNRLRLSMPVAPVSDTSMRQVASAFEKLLGTHGHHELDDGDQGLA